MIGVASMTAPLRRVAVRAPGAAMLKADAARWHYGPRFDPAEVTAEHAAFVALLQRAGCDVLRMEQDDQGIADAVFTYDASLMTPAGALLMSPGKPLRQGEQAVHRAFYDVHKIPIIGAIEGAATAEAGDTLWLDERTLLVGRGFRTNEAGLAQIARIIGAQDIEVIAFDLPCYTGEAACLHLMSLISMVDTKTALVCTPLLPVGLWRLLKERGITLIDAPFGEFEATGTLSTNVLATAPGRCIMLDGIPETRAALEHAGITVSVFSGDALCIGCEGGPTCMTRPILRAGTNTRIDQGP